MNGNMDHTLISKIGAETDNLLLIQNYQFLHQSKLSTFNRLTCTNELF